MVQTQTQSSFSQAGQQSQGLFLHRGQHVQVLLGPSVPWATQITQIAHIVQIVQIAQIARIDQITQISQIAQIAQIAQVA